MKILLSFLLVFALFSFPVWAVDATHPKAEESGQTEKTADKKEELASKSGKASAEDKTDSRIYKCSYYSVTLPDDWRAVLAPEEREGLVNAIFARNTNSTVVTMIIGPRAGADAKMIATMFAEQFKSAKAPVEKNGQYVFTFTQRDALDQKTITSTSCVAVLGDEFMITTWSGNQKEAQNFLKNNVKSENYSQLLPK